MNISKGGAISTISIILLLVLGGCSGMTQQEKYTAYGAGAGGVAGAIITGGSPLGTAGGAAVGGVIGHVISDDEDKK